MSVRVYVGNLSKDVEREAVEAVFADHAEEIVSIKLISDRKTGKCRGFGFVTVKTEEQADGIVEKFNGFLLEDVALKVEKAMPRTKGKEEDGEPTAATTAPSRRSGKGKGGSSKGKATPVFSDAESAQPDPRWAQELAKLKDLLAAQTTAP